MSDAARDIDLKPGESLVAVYVRVRRIPETNAWSAVLVSNGREYIAPSRALAVHAALKGAECT